MPAYDHHTRQLLRGLVHAARNVLQRSQTALSFLRLDAEDQPGLLASVEDLEREAQTLAVLLEAARNHVEAPPPQPQRGDAVEVVNAAWQALAASRGGAVLELRPSPPLPVHLDPLLIGQALQAVFRNALEARPEGLRVRVECTPSDPGVEGELTIGVFDNGPGFSEAALTHALEPFWSARAGQHGLGLSVAADAVRAHGGTLEIANASSAATATPCVPTAADAATSAAGQVGGATGPGGAVVKLHIPQPG